MTAPRSLAEPPQPTHPFGGIVTRGVALAIDGGAALALFAVGTVAVSFVFAALSVGEVGSTTSLVSAGTIWVAFVIGYFVVCWVSSGQTIGLRLMGLRVVGPSGKPPGLGRATVRYFGRLLSVTPFFAGYALVLVHPQRRALHDVLAGTFVVYAEASDEAIQDALNKARARRHRLPAREAKGQSAT